jgi:hypothetical protein
LWAGCALWCCRCVESVGVRGWAAAVAPGPPPLACQAGRGGGGGLGLSPPPLYPETCRKNTWREGRWLGTNAAWSRRVWWLRRRLPLDAVWASCGRRALAARLTQHATAAGSCGARGVPRGGCLCSRGGLAWGWVACGSLAVPRGGSLVAGLVPRGGRVTCSCGGLSRWSFVAGELDERVAIRPVAWHNCCLEPPRVVAPAAVALEVVWTSYGRLALAARA